MIQGSTIFSLKFMKSLRKVMGTFGIVSLLWQNCLWAVGPSLILEEDLKGARARVIKQLALPCGENTKSLEVLHGAMRVALSKGKEGAIAGAIGGITSELIAELSNRQVGRELAADLGRLGGVTAALFAELDVDIAHAVATNAVENNFLASKEFKGAAKKTQSNPEEEEETLSPSDASSKNMATKLGRNFAEKIGQPSNSMVSLGDQLQRERVTRRPEGHAAIRAGDPLPASRSRASTVSGSPTHAKPTPQDYLFNHNARNAGLSPSQPKMPGAESRPSVTPTRSTSAKPSAKDSFLANRSAQQQKILETAVQSPRPKLPAKSSNVSTNLPSQKKEEAEKSSQLQKKMLPSHVEPRQSLKDVNRCLDELKNNLTGIQGSKREKADHRVLGSSLKGCLEDSSLGLSSRIFADRLADYPLNSLQESAVSEVHKTYRRLGQDERALPQFLQQYQNLGYQPLYGNLSGDDIMRLHLLNRIDRDQGQRLSVSSMGDMPLVLARDTAVLGLPFCIIGDAEAMGRGPVGMSGGEYVYNNGASHEHKTGQELARELAGLGLTRGIGVGRAPGVIQTPTIVRGAANDNRVGSLVSGFENRVQQLSGNGRRATAATAYIEQKATELLNSPNLVEGLNVGRGEVSFSRTSTLPTPVNRNTFASAQIREVPKAPAAIPEIKSLLPGEGKVGTFAQLDKLRKKGDNLTPHHMPQDGYMNLHGVKTADGVSMMAEQPVPGSGGRHRQTRTFGKKPSLTETPREALGRGIKDARQIYQNDGVYTSEIRESLQDVIKQNKDKFPHLFNKKN